MPLGVLTDEEFEKELEKSNSKKQEGKVVITERGRGQKEEIPESARKLISEMAIEGNDISAIQENFNVSSSSISAYKHGATSTATYNRPQEELTKHNNAIRERIIKKARRKLVQAVNKIDDEKLDVCSAKELSSVARDMSSVIKNLEPEVKPEVNMNAQFVFYAPQVKKDIDYPIINVPE